MDSVTILLSTLLTGYTVEGKYKNIGRLYFRETNINDNFVNQVILVNIFVNYINVLTLLFKLHFMHTACYQIAC